MPLFILLGHDVENSAENRKQTRPAHLARINQLNEQGKVFLAGPCPKSHADTSEMLGSLMILDFANKADAEQWGSEEPYLKAGVYSHIDILPYIHLLPNDKNA